MELFPGECVADELRCRHCGGPFADDECVVRDDDLVWLVFHESCLASVVRPEGERVRIELERLTRRIGRSSLSSSADPAAVLAELEARLLALGRDLGVASTAAIEARDAVAAEADRRRIVGVIKRRSMRRVGKGS